MAPVDVSSSENIPFAYGCNLELDPRFADSPPKRVDWEIPPVRSLSEALIGLYLFAYSSKLESLS